MRDAAPDPAPEPEPAPDRPRPAGRPTARLFLALWPDAAARQALRDWQRSARMPTGAAVVAPERWHLTLHFLGAVPADALAALVPRLAVAGARVPVQLGRFAVWPRGIAVLEAEAPAAPLVALQGALGEALTGAGIAVEARPWRPHLTLARRAEGARAPDARIAWTAERYALVQSDGGYRTLATYPLN